MVAQVTRTCIGCRESAEAAQLLRVVAVPQPVGQGAARPTVTYVATPDVARRLPGRGAWLHRHPRCLASALRKRAFGRALRITGELRTELLIEMVGVGADTRADAKAGQPGMSTR